MRLSANLVLDTDTDTLYIEVPAAEGEGDVVVLSFDLKPLSADDKRRLHHVRPESQAQRLPAPTSTDGRLAALSVVAQMSVADRIRAEELDDDTVAAVAAIFPMWEPGQTVTVGDLRWWDGTAVECIQGHTTQADWTPDATPALWKIYRDPGAEVPAEWVQPTGAHDAYAIGDRLTSSRP